MSKNNGGVAFPSRLENHSDEEVIGFHGEPLGPKRFAAYPGITIRDYFAAKIMASLIQSAKGENLLGAPYPENNRNFAMAAYAISDAMLMEREK